MIVVKLEVAFEEDDGGVIKEAIESVLEQGRQYGAARVIETYQIPGSFPDNKDWQEKALSYIEIPVKTRIRID